ncbi:hypothetical protein ACLB2K_066457 [Fragaria x ananassa]
MMGRASTNSRIVGDSIHNTEHVNVRMQHGKISSKVVLPSLPTGDDLSWEAIHPSNVAAVDTKIFVTLFTEEETEGQILCFDVADPKATWSDREPRIRDDMGVFQEIFNEVLVVDSEEEEDEKLIFTFDYEKIIVSRMVLSAQGEIVEFIELVAKISLSGPLEGFKGAAYSCVHLGGQQVCFAFFWVTTLYELTSKYSYSKSAASPPLLSSSAAASDSEILTCNSISGSFSVQTLGLRLFEYNTSQLQDIYVLNMGGCFLL